MGIRYRAEYVSQIPETLVDGIVYVSHEYEIAALKCACGCGHRVILLLGDGHSVTDTHGYADVSPSIGVWDAPCRSHFFIRRGNVLWAESYSESAIQHAMKRQLKSHLRQSSKPKRWWTQFSEWFLRLIPRGSKK